MKNGCIITWYSQQKEVIRIEHYYDVKEVFKYLQKIKASGTNDLFTIHEVGDCILDCS